MLMRRKILVVDDAPVERAGTALSLMSLGFEVEQVQDGHEALSKVKTNLYALILMDNHMPTMTGSECARQIRDHESQTGERTPIVCFSSVDLEHGCQMCLDAGMDDCLSKSCTTEDLGQMIGRWNGPSVSKS